MDAEMVSVMPAAMTFADDLRTSATAAIGVAQHHSARTRLTGGAGAGQCNCIGLEAVVKKCS